MVCVTRGKCSAGVTLLQEIREIKPVSTFNIMRSGQCIVKWTGLFLFPGEGAEARVFLIQFSV